MIVFSGFRMGCNSPGTHENGGKVLTTNVFAVKAIGQLRVAEGIVRACMVGIKSYLKFLVIDDTSRKQFINSISESENFSVVSSFKFQVSRWSMCVMPLLTESIGVGGAICPAQLLCKRQRRRQVEDFFGMPERPNYPLSCEETPLCSVVRKVTRLNHPKMASSRVTVRNTWKLSSERLQLPNSRVQNVRQVSTCQRNLETFKAQLAAEM